MARLRGSLPKEALLLGRRSRFALEKPLQFVASLSGFQKALSTQCLSHGRKLFSMNQRPRAAVLR